MNFRSLSFLTTLVATAVTVSCTVVAQGAESFRYSLAQQQEWGNKLGFHLVLEDNSPQIPRKTDSLKLVLHVADGKIWRFPAFAPQWQWNRDYKVKAVIAPQNAQLWVDGKLVEDSKGGFTPPNQLGEVRSGLASRKADGLGEYLVRQTALQITSDRGKKLDFEFTPVEKRPLPVFAFEPQTPLRAPLKLAPGETVIIDTTFRLEPAILSDRPNAAAPFVDQFGQSIHANWPEKLRSEEDLKSAMQQEERRLAEMAVPPGFDRYGGSTTLGWREAPTGFFRVVQRNGYWWLITPEGNPCFYMAVDTVIGTFEKTQVAGREQFFSNLPGRTGELAQAWSEDGQKFGFTSANLIRKYGTSWEREAWQSAERRLRTWGFAGVGKWSGINTPQNGPIQMPSQPVIRRTGVPTIGRMPDIFDPTVRATFRTVLEKAITPHLNNPYVIGWSVGNEHEEVVLRSDIASMLKRDAGVPAKRALVAFGLKNIYGGDAAKMATAWKVAPGNNALAAIEAATAPSIPASDIETLRRHFADEYYGYIYRTIKEIDPNHLVFSFWMIAGWWEDEADWHLMARHCDVIGYDSYSYPFGDARLMGLLEKSGKPAMCGEFSFPSWHRGERGMGVFGASPPDDATAGQYYANWVRDAARNPYVIGGQWFQYRDQPITGRGSSESIGLTKDEHFAFGLVDITDRPKWDLIEPMRGANLSAAKLRQQTSQQKPTQN
jgi:hypothetical protein